MPPKPTPKKIHRKSTAEVDSSPIASPKKTRKVVRSPSPDSDMESMADFIVDDEAIEGSASEEEDEEEEEEEEELPEQVTIPVKKKRATVMELTDDEEEVDELVEETPKAAVRKVTLKLNSTPSKKAPAKKVIQTNDEASELDQSTEDTPKPSTKALGNTKKKPVKAPKGDDGAKETVPPKAVTPKSATKKATPAADSGSPTKRATRKKTIKSAATIEDSDDEVVALDPDDKMFPAPKVPTSRIKKRDLPVTPPLETRGHSKPVATSALESPTKKTRVVSPKKDDDGDKEVMLEWPPSPVVKPAVAEDKALTFSDDDETFGPITKKAASGSDDETFGPDIPLDPNAPQGSYLNDGRVWRISTLPTSCLVSQPELEDPMLKARGHYDNLPPLIPGALKSTSDLDDKASGRAPRAVRRINFSHWKPLLPGVKIKPILRVLTFANAGHFINPSRVSPLLVYGRPIGESRRELCIGRNTAVCLSTMMVTQSSLAADMPGLKFPYRGLKGIGHATEHERFVALLTMLAGVDTVYGQYWDSAWTYQTKNYSGSNSADIKVPDGFFNTFEASSPSKPTIAASTSSPSTFIGGLNYGENVPIYDARNVAGSFEWTEDVLGNLGAHLPLFTIRNVAGNVEVPPNALATVGFVCQMYNNPNAVPGTKEFGMKVTNYVRFVILLGVPLL